VNWWRFGGHIAVSPLARLLRIAGLNEQPPNEVSWMPMPVRTQRPRARLAAIALLLAALPALAAPGPVLVGIDAEFGHSTSTSAEAIKRGAQVAIDEINAAGGVLGGRMLALELRDNRSVPTRAVQNMRELGDMPDVVAVLTGKFSPAVIESVAVAHDKQLPLLAAWSAADEIVDNQRSPNYVFRLSLRDDWALAAMLEHARKRGARRVGLMLPNTAWGRSSLAATERRIKAIGSLRLAEVSWYNWGDKSLLPGYLQIKHAGADALLLVANELEGSVLVNELAQLPPDERLPLIGHWGVTGGRFFTMATPGLAAVDLTVVQTYSFIGARDAAAQRVLAALKRNHGVDGARQVESPVGVAHAYDLVHLLARAIAKAGSTERARIRDALERLGSYRGLVRNYREPFTPARHEALAPSNVFMAAYERDGALVRIDKP
jgi:branched-chain amino acid transport system substrate-binding protein